ncbi:sensor histidine kinase [Psychroserpens luteolus]|uniref:sensor histidine kinase n=1 Tax=Psychroserpens luteolus TaxID=2855840 RepID=UPI001E58E290|nr:histidine kinase [Psychroserpens luteolus]MCD2259200.1 histidine kinase [Psychroserpens luteolus]
MKRYIEIVLNILFWLICFYLIFSIISPKNREVEIINGTEIVKISYDGMSVLGTIIGFVLKMGLYYFNVYFLSKYFNKKQFKTYFVFLFVASIITIGIELLKNRIIYGEEFILFETFIATIWLYMFFVGISFVHIIILRWQKEEALKQKLKEDKLTAELQLLKSQINPHFLFNALNNLLSIAEKHKQTEVSSGIAQLSELLRFLLHDTSDETILLSKEIEFIEHYIQLNKLRFDTNDPISIAFKKKGDLSNIDIAPALLIPFVENAFKHGIDIYNKSFIDINLIANNNTIHFVCRNSLKEKSNTDAMLTKNSGIGLQNVKRRLDILYPNKHDLNISETDNTYIVDLKLAYD